MSTIKDAILEKKMSLVQLQVTQFAPANRLNRSIWLNLKKRRIVTKVILIIDSPNGLDARVY